MQSSRRPTTSPPPIVLQDHSSSPEGLPKSTKDWPPFDPSNVNGPSDPGLKPRQQTTWHHRKRSPGVKWHEKWTESSWKNGRVLLIDYLSRDDSKDHKLKVSALEFQKVDELRKFYNDPELSKPSALRIIHVQNASWATQYLLRKFNIDNSDDLVGTAFGRWARFEKPQLRAGKPVLNGKTFAVQRDPWRGVTRTAFGLDYLKHYPAYSLPQAEEDLLLMELNHYDTNDIETHGYDAYVQRLSVYIQRADSGLHAPEDTPEIRNPYTTAVDGHDDKAQRHSDLDGQGHKPYRPNLDSLDNGSTIIIFEHSTSGSVSDTLIGAREQLESRWRRLTFYLAREETLSSEFISLQCMNDVLRDIFKGLSYCWEKYVSLCETHVSILEEKIYGDPEDESRAPEIWTNTNLWLKVERLMFIHIDIIKELKANLREMTEEEPSDGWLYGTQDVFEKLTNLAQEDLIKPTTSLSDQMYKSVEIRDSRQSLQLGLSMWRLSWITFIFLPLTFIVGFFGMNVDTFVDNPSLKWYFIVSVPLMFSVLILWYTCKHSVANRRSPVRRARYESLYRDLSRDYPRLWARDGPREDFVPQGILGTIRWRLLKNWFDPSKTGLAGRHANPETRYNRASRIGRVGQDSRPLDNDDGAGTWARIQERLLWRWSGRIVPASHHPHSDIEGAALLPSGGGGPLLPIHATELVAMTPHTAAASVGLPEASTRPAVSAISPPLTPMRSESPGADKRPGTGNSGPVMVEERRVSDDESARGSSDFELHEPSTSLGGMLGIPIRVHSN